MIPGLDRIKIRRYNQRFVFKDVPLLVCAETFMVPLSANPTKASIVATPPTVFRWCYSVQGPEGLRKVTTVLKTAAFAYLLYRAIRMHQQICGLPKPVFLQIAHRRLADDALEATHDLRLTDSGGVGQIF